MDLKNNSFIEKTIHVFRKKPCTKLNAFHFRKSKFELLSTVRFVRVSVHVFVQIFECTYASISRDIKIYLFSFLWTTNGLINAQGIFKIYSFLFSSHSLLLILFRAALFCVLFTLFSFIFTIHTCFVVIRMNSSQITIQRDHPRVRAYAPFIGFYLAVSGINFRSFTHWAEKKYTKKWKQETNHEICAPQTTNEQTTAMAEKIIADNVWACDSICNKHTHTRIRKFTIKFSYSLCHTIYPIHKLHYIRAFSLFWSPNELMEAENWTRKTKRKAAKRENKIRNWTKTDFRIQFWPYADDTLALLLWRSKPHHHLYAAIFAHSSESTS